MSTFSAFWETSWLTVFCNAALKVLIVFQQIENNFKDLLVVLMCVLHGK